MMEARILNQFRAIVGRGLITEPSQLHTYECDGLTNFRVMPQAVLLPTLTEEVQAIVRVCNREKIPFVARGSGTGLSGGALPAEKGIVISLARMNRILEVDLPNARVVVEPGVINADVTQRVAPHGYFYAPDPSSQSVCSIGGNVAENSGGAQVLLLLQQLQREFGLTYVLISHSLPVVAQLATQVAVMCAGRFVEMGPARQILEHSRHAYTRQLLASVPEVPLPK